MYLFVQKLTVLDFAYLCAERGFIGESWHVDLFIGGQGNSQNMLVDFGPLKKQVKQLVDNLVDHKLVLPEHLPELTIEKVDAESTAVHYVIDEQQQFSVFSPNEAFCFLPTNQVNIEAVQHYLEQKIQEHLPKNVQQVRLTLYPESNPDYFHYCHGLKKHEGNCQRIVHGHRSIVEVIDQTTHQPDITWQSYWHKHWRVSYLGSTDDQVNIEALDYLTPKIDTKHLIAFRYWANQGWFELLVPKATVTLINTETTAECLAEYMVQQMAIQRPQQQFIVKFYEGIGKGGAAFTHDQGQIKQL